MLRGFSLACTTPMCAQGRVSVLQMLRVFDELKRTRPAFPAAQYAPTVNAIHASFQDAHSVFSEWIPFNEDCCALKDLGAQADTVTASMLQAAGAAPIGTGPGSTESEIDLEQIINAGLWIGGLLVLANFLPLLRRQ